MCSSPNISPSSLFWNPQNQQISKLTLLFRFGEDLMEILPKNKLSSFFVDTLYLYQVQFDAITSIIRHQTVVNETKITSMFYFRIWTHSHKLSLLPGSENTGWQFVFWQYLRHIFTNLSFEICWFWGFQNCPWFWISVE